MNWENYFFPLFALGDTPFTKLFTPTLTGSHLGFKCTKSSLGMSIESTKGQGMVFLPPLTAINPNTPFYI